MNKKTRGKWSKNKKISRNSDPLDSRWPMDHSN